jgi:hypothetical protein
MIGKLLGTIPVFNPQEDIIVFGEGDSIGRELRSSQSWPFT